MRRSRVPAVGLAACIVLVQSASAGGAVPAFNYLNQTATRLVSEPSLGVSDPDEKDYAWGDLDRDGDVDLVVVRKQPFTSPGRRPNVLFMNVNGILTDQTATYASTAINVPQPDQGFLTPTNDRDVIVIDVNGDGWLDVVTAVSISDSLPKHIGHPRVYMNQGLVGGTWGGLVFDNARIPDMMSSSMGIGGVPQTPAPGFNPRFCSVAGGDLTGDARPELFFGDYDSGGSAQFLEPVGADFNQKLLLNDGNGYFTDVTTERITATASPGGTYPAWQASFGSSAAIADMNGDGRLDILYVTTETPPQYIAILYNSPASPGFFTANAQVIFFPSDAPYFITPSDLNNDGRLDVVETDDNTDKYRLATGVTSGVTSWTGSMGIPNSPSGGFGDENMAADLNGDGWNDILVTDVDVDIEGCSRTANIVLNNANPPNVTFTRNTGGIPDSMLHGVHDFAVFDINGDGWNDLVIGRCSGTQVWIFDAPPPPPILGDLTGDGVVNALDLGIMLSGWSIPATSPGCAGSSPCAADLNLDGFVNTLDLGIMLSNWTL